MSGLASREYAFCATAMVLVLLLYSLWLTHSLGKLQAEVGRMDKGRRICTPIDVGRPGESDRAWLLP